jgi:hypothetical protein
MFQSPIQVPPYKIYISQVLSLARVIQASHKSESLIDLCRSLIDPDVILGLGLGRVNASHYVLGTQRANST